MELDPSVVEAKNRVLSVVNENPDGTTENRVKPLKAYLYGELERFSGDNNEANRSFICRLIAEVLVFARGIKNWDEDLWEEGETMESLLKAAVEWAWEAIRLRPQFCEYHLFMLKLSTSIDAAAISFNPPPNAFSYTILSDNLRFVDGSAIVAAQEAESDEGKRVNIVKEEFELKGRNTILQHMLRLKPADVHLNWENWLGALQNLRHKVYFSPASISLAVFCEVTICNATITYVSGLAQTPRLSQELQIQYVQMLKDCTQYILRLDDVQGFNPLAAGLFYNMSWCCAALSWVTTQEDYMRANLRSQMFVGITSLDELSGKYMRMMRAWYPVVNTIDQYQDAFKEVSKWCRENMGLSTTEESHPSNSSISATSSTSSTQSERPRRGRGKGRGRGRGRGGC